MYLCCEDFPESIFKVEKENVDEIVEKNGKLIKISSSKDENRGKFGFIELRKLHKISPKYYLLEIKDTPFMMNEAEIDEENDLDGMAVFDRGDFIEYKKCHCENIGVTNEDGVLSIQFHEDIDCDIIEVEINGEKRRININSIEKARKARQEKLEAEFEENKGKIVEFIQEDNDISLAEIARRLGKSRNYLYNNKKYRDIIDEIRK